MAKCPFCNKNNDLQTQVGDVKNLPCAGDISICIGCGEASVFNEDETVRKITNQELMQLAVENPGVILQMQKAKQLIRLKYQVN